MDMKKSRFNENQIIKILKEQDSGRTAADICRDHGLSQGTFFRMEEQVWRNGAQPGKKTQGPRRRAHSV